MRVAIFDADLIGHKKHRLVIATYTTEFWVYILFALVVGFVTGMLVGILAMLIKGD